MPRLRKKRGEAALREFEAMGGVRAVVMALTSVAGIEAFAGGPPSVVMVGPRVLRAATSLALRGGVDGASMSAAQGKIVVRTPSDQEKKTASSWPTWGCGVSTFPWSYPEAETCLVLEGEVTVTPDGGEPVKIKAGDMAVFPEGMSCTWDVTAPIKKHYNFD